MKVKLILTIAAFIAAFTPATQAATPNKKADTVYTAFTTVVNPATAAEDLIPSTSTTDLGLVQVGPADLLGFSIPTTTTATVDGGSYVKVGSAPTTTTYASSNAGINQVDGTYSSAVGGTGQADNVHQEAGTTANNKEANAAS